MKLVISSGHGKYIRGASGSPVPPQLDEVDEARKVTDRVAEVLQDMGHDVITFHDNTSKDQGTNLNAIVNFHNKQTRDYDVSCHFNAYDGKAHGCEVLYKTQEKLAKTVVDKICTASGLTNRGPKYRSDLKFLNSTAMPAILLEICFCDNTADSNVYHSKFEDICIAIAEGMTGEDAGAIPEPGPEPEPEPEPVPPPAPELYPTLGRGDIGPWVRYMQLLLGDIAIDGDFGPATESAVETFQGINDLDADGICGPQTWAALTEQGVPEPPPDAFTPQQEGDIKNIAAFSEIADYSWRDRGRAPDGYTQGMALAYAQVYRKLKAGDSAAEEMAEAVTINDKDALYWYRDVFEGAEMDNSKPGADTLRHLWALMLGQGMRESSGKHCCGRDQSASNTDSNTCEAGLFQTSYNAHSCSSSFDKLFNEYQENLWSGYLSTFEDDVDCSSADWNCYGSGSGYQFQEMCKNLPAFSAETAAITLRNLCNHYGPIKRYETELRQDADVMFQRVQDYVDQIETVA
jgi:peptidoglycan hydrolase-like protein with peptidoglycan-binding domain